MPPRVATWRWSALLLGVSLLAGRPVLADEPAQLGFVRGYSWGWNAVRGDYASDAAQASMAKLAETGVDHVCIAFAAEMPTAQTPRILWGDQNPRMVSNDEVRAAIRLARRHNLKVILKPTVNPADGVWRAWIKFFRPATDEETAAGHAGVADPWASEESFRKGEVVDTQRWDQWWDDYRRFLEHYARIAADERVEAFCVGCEMSSTEGFETRWRATIEGIRRIYGGVLTYNCNHGRESTINWWDQLDLIGVSGYYPIPPRSGESLEQALATVTPKEQMVAELADVRHELRAVSERWGKPILFIETGVTNVRGAARRPWSHAYSMPAFPISDEEQARYYEAMFETFWQEPWFHGFCWWDWPARLYPAERASRIRSFCVYGRPAAGILRDWYTSRERPVLDAGPSSSTE
ncbi:hypothetical protein KOR34_01830 [Posidoniimonas corsicana]|uniref:Glycosyl hydrolase family 53 n=1 Tax=Posidoniimonas corsicana TaxID=1938618 RepID=A0A5C5VCF7_9BACT|nr:hypothetical protein [Posidoniimonas corsicana]TWT35295.1 hypothetical protein KOR34_01830 [Posidoniimonas corsicana]